MKKLNLYQIPAVPGSYRFFNELEEVIYVGKAKNLKRRLSQYQNAKRRKAHAKMRKILKNAKRLDFEICENELHALIRENELIQVHHPKWNVMGAFYFLYPMIGMCVLDRHLYVCYTTRPELFPQFQFHGAFRSRYRTREGFFALIELLRFIGHAASRTQLVKSGVNFAGVKHTYIYGFRQIPECWPAQLDQFLRGECFGAVETLSLNLLERPSALAKCKEIQEHLHELRAWWLHEMLPLQKARNHCAWATYPVAQKERDLLFIRLRSRNPLPSSTEESAQLISAHACQKVQP